MAYTPISLGDIMQQAGAINAQKQRAQLGDIALQNAQTEQAQTTGITSTLASNPNAGVNELSKYGLAGIDAATRVGQARSSDANFQNLQLLHSLQQKKFLTDTVAADPSKMPQVADQLTSLGVQGHPDGWQHLPPEQIQANAKQASAALDAQIQQIMTSLVPPEKQFDANNAVNIEKMKTTSAEGINKNTVDNENTRQQNDLKLRKQEFDQRQSAERKPQLVDVPMPDGTVQKQWITPGATAGTNVGAATTPTTGMGAGRIQQMVGRITLAGNEVSKAAHNLMAMNAGANAGFLGIGKDQGHGIMNSVKSALANTMSSEDTKSYNIKVAGVTRNLAAIEAAGNMPPGSLTGQMSAVVAQPGDTHINRLERMAEIRQIADAGLESIVTQPGISAAQKDQIQGIRDSIAKSIPFTQDDVLNLKQSDDPKATLASMATKAGLPSGQSAAPLTNAQGWKLHSDAQGRQAYVSPDGKQFQAIP